MYKPGANKTVGKKAERSNGAEAMKRGTSAQTRLLSIVNKNLFSDHFLGEILPERMEEWGKDEKIREVFEKIKQLYVKQKKLLEKYNEPQLEEHFIKPIFGYLGHHFEVQETAPSTRRQPDYAFFPDDKTRREAHSNKGKISFYTKAVAVGDAKAWEKSLDKKTGRGAAFEEQNPSFQIDTYLRDTEPRWAILTNGRCWRIYFQDTSYKLNSYFEIDLVDIINKDDLESFKYFYFFFRLEAFLPDERGKNFLDQVYEGSIDYAKKLGESLQENVYAALKILADGFLGLDENKLKKNPETIKEIHSNALVLLYRMLFVLYAESRGLLDTINETYNRTFSFNSIKREVAETIDRGGELHSWHTQYWNRLKNLFSLINGGSESKGIPKEDLFVPPYNGSLFNPSKNEFLERHAVGDSYLAKVIDLLSRSGGGFIDYSTLDIRHLGSIYEGLLEFKLKIAEEDMVSVREKGKEVWVPRDKAGGKEIHEEVEKGGLYLVTDKGERKTTGSYYTPGYIVKYIVENTLSPIVKQKIEESRENSGKESEAILSINVLDPAMGSGHFLVEAVDFLARVLLEAVSNDMEKGLITEAEYSTEWAKREVVSHCIYGVDLNPLAVELAKLSLWLATIAKDKPLSFLDHRLKCGNSLIGAKLEDLPWHPKKKAQDRKQKRIDISGFVKKLVDTTKKLSEISDDTLDNIKRKEKIFSDFKETMAYDMIKTLADVRTSIHFGNDVDERTYGTYTGDAWWSSEIEWKQRRDKEFAQKARKIADEKKFFHWELEFPEVFFEAGKKKENPGFDAVIGNPPWGESVIQELKEVLSKLFMVSPKNLNAFDVFTRLALRLKRINVGFLVPRNSCRSNDYIELRKHILETSTVRDIFDWKLFPDVTQECISIVLSPESYDNTFVRINGEEFQTQKDLKESVDFIFNIYSTKEELGIKNKIGRFTDRLDNFVKIKRGEEISRAAKVIQCPKCTFWRVASKQEEVRCPQCGNIFKVRETKEDTLLCRKEKTGSIKIVDGEDIGRYSMDQGVFICFDKKGITSKLKTGIYEPNKILMQKISTRLVATYDDESTMFTQNVYGLKTKKGVNVSPYFIVALLNSKTLNFFQEHTFNVGAKWTTAISIENIRYKIPVRRINFTTPPDRRTVLVGEAKQLYQKYLATRDRKSVLDFLEAHLPKDSRGNLITEREQSDVIHDFLAYLAEQMIELNKSKNEEIRNFLEWLEREIGAKIETLTNRAKLEQYCDIYLGELLEILKKNKKKIPINLSNRAFQDNLKREFEKSNTTLSLLRNKIEATDELIDQIIYKLYGFIDEEIELIESSFKKEGLREKEKREVGL